MGSSGRYYFTVITVLYLGATILLQNLADSKDLHQEVACFRDRLRINCGDQSFIAIHEAFFTTRLQHGANCGETSGIEHEHVRHDDDDDEETERGEDEDESTSTSTDPTDVSSPSCHEDLRVSINRRCSGSRSCTYSYQDLTEKKCPNMRGQFVVRYDCVRNSSVVKFCNIRLEGREGYFSSPGFPQFYPQLEECGWALRSRPGQRIVLRVLHLHLRPPVEVAPTAADPDSLFALGLFGSLREEELRCDSDSLDILDGGEKRASVCGNDVSALRTVMADSGRAEVRFRSAAFAPASGFLMYYRIQGCPELHVPPGVRLVEGSNSSASVFECDDDRVFNDTLEGERFLSCVRDHHWNDTLPPCVALDEVFVTPTVAPMIEESAEVVEEQAENATIPSAERTTAEVKETAYLEDIIIPSVLIGVLLIANAIIVATILIIKKRQRAKLMGDEETFEDPRSEPLVPDVKDV